MQIRIGETTYTRLRNLRFAAETDITGASMPINGFSADIQTDTLPGGFSSEAELRDDLGNVWAKYILKRIYHCEDNWMRLEAVSTLQSLEGRTAPATMYTGETVGTVVGRILSLLPEGGCEFADPSLEARTITGFCPEQNWRERLLHICLATGLHLRDYGADHIIVEDWPDADTLIPAEDTYFRPEIGQRELKLGVKCTAYTFTPGTPQQGEESVEAGGVTYIVTGQEVVLSRLPLTPSDATLVDVSDCMLLHSGNAGDVLSRMAQYHFNAVTVDFSCVNDYAYWPADRLTVRTGETAMVTGYARRMDWSFGKEAKARVELVGCKDVSSITLTVLYQWEGANLGKRLYQLPAGYSYNLPNPYLDSTGSAHRYLFRPLTEAVTGRLTEDTTETVEYAVALDLTRKTGVLKIVSVDELTQDEEEVVRIT